MQILKAFIDGAGRKHRVGEGVPEDWDRTALLHYWRHGMVGNIKVSRSLNGKPLANSRKPAGPSEKKPQAPSETIEKGFDASAASSKSAEAESSVEKTQAAAE